MGLINWFTKNKDPFSDGINKKIDSVKEKYTDLSLKAIEAKCEEDIANEFTEDKFCKAVLEAKITFRPVIEKKVRSFWENYEKSVFKSSFECFEFSIHHKPDGNFMEFKINFATQRGLNLFRLNNIIRYGIDKDEPEQGYRIY